MGYAMFAARKIMLTNSIFNINQQLMDIQQKRDDLFDAEAALSDNKIDSTDIAACRRAGIAISYGMTLAANQAGFSASPEYQIGRAAAEKEAYEKFGASWGANIGGAVAGAGIGAGIGVAAGLASGPIGWLALGVAALGAYIGNKCSAKTKARKEYVEAIKPLKKIYLYAVSRSIVEKIIERLDLNAELTRNVEDADIVIAHKNFAKGGAKVLNTANDYRIQVFYIKTNSMAQIQKV